MLKTLILTELKKCKQRVTDKAKTIEELEPIEYLIWITVENPKINGAIADYEDNQDKIAIYDSQISGFGDLSIIQTGSTVTIQDVNDSNIYYATVNDILVSELTASDFLFAT